MYKKILLVCLIYIESVTPNPINQPPCSICPTYSQVPFIIQPAPNSNPIPPQTAPGFDDTLNQVLFSKILSNPSVQKILDPNTRLYNQNGVEIPRQPSGVPNVINNYFIVPPEFFNLNDTVKMKKDKTEARRVNINNNKGINTNSQVKTENKKKNPNVEAINVEKDQQVRAGRRKGRKGPRRGLKSQRLTQQSETEVKQEVVKTEEETPKKKRRNQNQRKPEPAPVVVNKEDDDSIEETSRKIERPKTKPKRRSKPQKKIVEESEEIVIEVPDSIETIEVEVPNTQAQIIERPRRRRKKQKSVNIDKDEEVRPNLETKRLKDLEIPTDNLENLENRRARNSKSDTAREPMRENSNIPIPDDVIKNFFPYMNMASMYYPNNYYPYNFEQYYPYLGPNRNNYRRNKKRRKNNSSNDKQNNTIEIIIKPKPRENATEVVETNTETIEIEEKPDSEQVEDTTESIELITEEPVTEQIELIEEEEEEERVQKENYEVVTEKIEDLYEYLTPELGTEDVIPVMRGNGIVDDYYPIFHDDSYYSNEETTKNEENERYYYRYGNSEDSDRRKYEKDKKYIEKDAELIKPTKISKERENLRTQFIESEKELGIDSDFLDLPNKEAVKSKKFDAEEISFHTPPRLENVDFITKKVERYRSSDRLDIDDHIDPISVDSDERPQYNKVNAPEIERVRVSSRHNRPRYEDIETVFAKSKVAVYGRHSEESEENASVASYENHGDSNKYKDGDTTYVVARSLGNIDDYW